MTNAHKKKENQLQMSLGKASGKLRKSILFYLLKKVNENFCYRCNKEIKRVEELSIEHKQAWLDSENPIELFFDLKNISFSHLKCNCIFRRNFKKIEYPKDEKWCWKCRQFKHLGKFQPSAVYNRGKACTSCCSELRKEYRQRTGKR